VTLLGSDMFKRDFLHGHTLPGAVVSVNIVPTLVRLCKVRVKEIEDLAPALPIHQDCVLAAVEDEVFVGIHTTIGFAMLHDRLAHRRHQPQLVAPASRKRSSSAGGDQSGSRSRNP
jgi:hypothetical protein